MGPAKRHGLSTLSSKFEPCTQMPAVPARVKVLTKGLRPPNASDSVYRDITWAYHIVAYGENDASSGRAIEFGGMTGLNLLEHGILNADLAANGMTAKSSPLTNRVAITRTGCSLSGGQWEHRDLINVVIRLASNLPPSLKKRFQALANRFSYCVKCTEHAPGAVIPTAGSMTELVAQPAALSTRAVAPAGRGQGSNRGRGRRASTDAPAPVPASGRKRKLAASVGAQPMKAMKVQAMKAMRR